MKAHYRGHDIEAKRENCMGGWPLMYYSVFRTADGYECTSGFTEDSSPARTQIRYLKERIDEELASDDPWGERAAEHSLGYMQQRGMTPNGPGELPAYGGSARPGG